ncbi:hypothetical protein Agub_g10944 [Astrephomene gubernaculifera]|uniref:Kinesin motor domain-containing protein n=1 Tax=Astrephomene gubernaculifera TaxID=47775 RepID=A0AAD3HQB9_9CHLO|nr:hypothetical protein Agub_g10944 [Astrephomene gubernaculifera]
MSQLGSPRSTTTTMSELPGQPSAQNKVEKVEKVWVGVRIRPLLRHESEAKETVAWKASGSGTLSCMVEEKNAFQQSTYQYDRVFADTCTSDEVYAAAAQPMVQSAMKGYNCTLFAYGQTGSGKTTTMRSVMRHAAKDIFAHIARTRDRDFVLKMCAIEVYNEVVHDLFVDVDTNLKINDDKEKGPVVVDLTEQSIESEEHLLKMLKAIEGRRQVRETKMNQKSSRSHLVVRLYVESRPASIASDDELSSDDSSEAEDDDGSVGGETSSRTLAPVLSTINFVDLAGSERLNQASMTDDVDKEKLRQKEASNINVSLLTLGKVIRALGKRGEHVPYRESNLTRILQPSLAGNSRMAIVCTLSPAAGSVDNSRAALHFANHAKAVTMRPVLNEVRNEQAIIHKMEVEIMELRRKLARMDRPDRSSRQGTKQLLAEKDAELKAKEEQMRKALQERAALERRLNQMEKFIIRGGSGSPAPGLRRSFDGLDSLASSMAAGANGPGGARGAGLLGSSAVGTSVRASWNPGSMSALDTREPTSAGKTGKGVPGSARIVGNPGRLLLDYLLPPGVREAVNRLSVENPTQRGAAAAPTGTDARNGYNLRMEIGKLQAPEGSKAEEARTALQAEVRCCSQRPDAAAVVAAAAGATPDTADRLLEQLTQMLGSLEQRQRDGQEPGSSQAGGTAPAANPNTASDPASAAATPSGKETAAAGALQRQQPSNAEDEANLIALLRTEVARLQRLRAINVQANQAIESLLSKVAMLEAGSTGGSNPHMDGLLQVPAVLERLQTALQEADELDEGDEDMTAAEGAAAAAGGAGDHQYPTHTGARTVARRRVAAARDDGEATSEQRYDSPAAAPQVTTAAAQHSPARLSGSKLPRALLTGADLDGEGDSVLVKSPRRGLMASPHGGAGLGASTTPNSRLSAGVRAGHVQHHGADSPRAGADVDGHADELCLRRMRTPSLSMQASEAELMSAGRPTASISSRGVMRDTERAKRIIGREKEAIHAWYAAEVARLKAAFRTQTQADVDAMREAVERYRGMFEETQERVERLNVQKQLLIKQVLQLELAVDEAEQQEARSNAMIAKLMAERDQAVKEAAQAKSREQAALLQAQQAQAMAFSAQQTALMHASSSDQHAFNDDDDDWADAPTTETLLGQLCELWHKLNVPLVYRSRFFMLFRSKELIYLQMEQRRLKHRLEQVEKELEGDYLSRSKALDKAKRALDLERKVLAQAMRFTYNEREREMLFDQWGVSAHSKGRKLQLVKKLWDPAKTKDQVSMEASATVVCALAGPDATEQFMQLVFGNTAEVCARPTHVGALMTTLVRRVTTPRQRKAAAAAGGGTNPLTSSVIVHGGSSGNASAGGVTPRRNSSTSLLASLAGRVGSILSQQPAASRLTTTSQQPAAEGDNAQAAPASGGAVSQHTAPPSVPPLMLNGRGASPGTTSSSGVVGGGGPIASGLGPMTRNLANTAGHGGSLLMGSIKGHPSATTSILSTFQGNATSIASMRGRTSYADS